MSFSGVGDVFIPRTLNKKKTPGAPDWEQLFGEGVFLRQWRRMALLIQPSLPRINDDPQSTDDSA
jgi:hypothetical protein